MRTMVIFFADSGSSSSKLTSSDKLSALPGIQSSPAVGRFFYSGRVSHRSFDASSSLPVIQSSPVTSPPARIPTPASRFSGSENSNHGRETPRQRVSFDSERGTLPPALRNLRQGEGHCDPPFTQHAHFLIAFSSRTPQQQELGRSAESSRAGSRRRHFSLSSPHKEEAATPLSRSPSPSHTTSPRRLFGINLHRAHSQDEPFIPHNPFQFHIRFFPSPSSTPQRSSLELTDTRCGTICNCCLPLPVICSSSSQPKIRAWGDGMRIFLLDTLPRQLYLYALLRLPSFYFSRVARIFEDAEISKHEVQRMIAACAPAQADSTGVIGAAASVGMTMGTAMAGTPPRLGLRPGNSVFPFPNDWDPSAVSPALTRFKHSWEIFVESLLREWKTLNLVSVLLCTSVLSCMSMSKSLRFVQGSADAIPNI
jgi:hypothetical protein